MNIKMIKVGDILYQRVKDFPEENIVVVVEKPKNENEETADRIIELMAQGDEFKPIGKTNEAIAKIKAEMTYTSLLSLKELDTQWRKKLKAILKPLRDKKDGTIEYNIDNFVKIVGKLHRLIK